MLAYSLQETVAYEAHRMLVLRSDYGGGYVGLYIAFHHIDLLFLVRLPREVVMIRRPCGMGWWLWRGTRARAAIS